MQNQQGGARRCYVGGDLNAAFNDFLHISFVLDMAHDDNDATIVRSTIDLAHNLGYRVVAEGIENPVTHRMLTELGCDGAQGFHFSRPVSSEDFGRLLAHA